jgi:branched-chain amino acid transport system substrate-binding protein
MKRYAKLLLGTAIALCAVDNAAGQVRVGISLPMTGPLAFYGVQIKSGVDQAIDDLNERGGVLGTPIELLTYDDQCDVKQGLRIAERLVKVDKVAFVIGPACSSVALAVVPVLGSSPKLVVDILSSAVASALTENGYSNIFRIVPRADRQGPIVSAYLQRIRGYNIAILNDGTPYATEIDTALRRAWPNLETDTKFQGRYSFAQSDFAPLIAQLRASDIKVVYVAGLPTGLGNLVREARAEHLPALFVASEMAWSPQLWSIAGESTNGILFTFFPDPSRNSQTAPVVARMRQKGREPSVNGLYAYAAVQAWGQAVTTAGTFDAEKVASMLHDRPLETVVGSVAFDSKGDVKELEYVFYRWQQGRITQMNDRPPPPPPPPE